MGSTIFRVLVVLFISCAWNVPLGEGARIQRGSRATRGIGGFISELIFGEDGPPTRMQVQLKHTKGSTVDGDSTMVNGRVSFGFRALKNYHKSNEPTPQSMHASPPTLQQDSNGHLSYQSAEIPSNFVQPLDQNSLYDQPYQAGPTQFYPQQNGPVYPQPFQQQSPQFYSQFSSVPPSTVVPQQYDPSFYQSGSNFQQQNNQFYNQAPNFQQGSFSVSQFQAPAPMASFPQQNGPQYPQLFQPEPPPPSFQPYNTEQHHLPTQSQPTPSSFPQWNDPPVSQSIQSEPMLSSFQEPNEEPVESIPLEFSQEENVEYDQSIDSEAALPPLNEAEKANDEPVEPSVLSPKNSEYFKSVELELPSSLASSNNDTQDPQLIPSVHQPFIQEIQNIIQERPSVQYTPSVQTPPTPRPQRTKPAQYPSFQPPLPVQDNPQYTQPSPTPLPVFQHQPAHSPPPPPPPFPQQNHPSYSHPFQNNPQHSQSFQTAPPIYQQNNPRFQSAPSPPFQQFNNPQISGPFQLAPQTPPHFPPQNIQNGHQYSQSFPSSAPFQQQQNNQQYTTQQFAVPYPQPPPLIPYNSQPSPFPQSLSSSPNYYGQQNSQPNYQPQQQFSQPPSNNLKKPYRSRQTKPGEPLPKPLIAVREKSSTPAAPTMKSKSNFQGIDDYLKQWRENKEAQKLHKGVKGYSTLNLPGNDGVIGLEPPPQSTTEDPGADGLFEGSSNGIFGKLTSYIKGMMPTNGDSYMNYPVSPHGGVGGGRSL